MRAIHIQNTIMLVAALLLIGMATPRFLAAIWMAAGTPIYEDIAAGKLVTPEDIATLIESREVALSLVDLPRAATDLGVAYVASGATPEALQQAVDSVKAGLEMAPVSPFAWLRLAGLLATDPARHDEAVAAWRTSRALALHEPFLLHGRIRIGIALYTALNEEDRELLRADIETAYANNRNLLRNFGRSTNLLEWFKFFLRDSEKTAFLER